MVHAPWAGHKKAIFNSRSNLWPRLPSPDRLGISNHALATQGPPRTGMRFLFLRLQINQSAPKLSVGAGLTAPQSWSRASSRGNRQMEYHCDLPNSQDKARRRAGIRRFVLGQLGVGFLAVGLVTSN